MRRLLTALALAGCVSAPAPLPPSVAAGIPADARAVVLAVPDGVDAFPELARALALEGYGVESSDGDTGSITTTSREEGAGMWRLLVSVGPEVLVFVDWRLSATGAAGVQGANEWRRAEWQTAPRYFGKAVEFAQAVGWGDLSYR